MWYVHPPVQVWINALDQVKEVLLPWRHRQVWLQHLQLDGFHAHVFQPGEVAKCKYLHISNKQTKYNFEDCNDQSRWAMWSWTATTTGTTTTTTTSKQRLVLWTQTHRRRRLPRWVPPWPWSPFRLLGFQLSFLLVGGWLKWHKVREAKTLTPSFYWPYPGFSKMDLFCSTPV